MPPKNLGTPVPGQKTLLGFFQKASASKASPTTVKTVPSTLPSKEDPVTPLSKKKPLKSTRDGAQESLKPIPTPATSSQGPSASPEDVSGKRKRRTVEIASEDDEEEGMTEVKPVKVKRRGVAESEDEEMREKKRTRLSSDMDDMDLSDPVTVFPKRRAAKMKPPIVDDEDLSEIEIQENNHKTKAKSKSTDDEDYFDDDPALDDIDPDSFIVPDDESEDERPKKKTKSKSQVVSKDNLMKKFAHSSEASEEEEEDGNTGRDTGEDVLKGLSRFEAPPEDEEMEEKQENEIVSVPSKATLKARKRAMQIEDSKGRGEKSEEREQAFDFLRNIRDADQHPIGHPEYDPRTLYVPPSAFKKFTPFEKQFWEIKKNCFDTILFFQKGKFYELYEDDATIGHREFDLKMTDRVKMRMVGVPEGQFGFWANKFIARGYKVGRVDQCETAIGMGMRKEKEKSKGGGKADNIVKRELKMVLTSGTAVDGDDDGVAGNCLSVKEFLPNPEATPIFGICLLDAPTAAFDISEFRDDVSRTKLETVLRRLKLKELVHEKGNLSIATMRMLKSVLPSECQWTALKPTTEFLTASDAKERLKAKLRERIGKRKGGGPDEEDEEMEDANENDFIPDNIKGVLEQEHAMSAMGGMMWYLDQLNLGELITTKNFTGFDPLQEGETLLLDGQTLAHIEVLNNSLGGEDGSLLRLFTKCSTPFGKRMFRKWLCAPLRDVKAINDRLDTVTDLMESEMFADHFSNMSKGMPDLERLLARVHAKSCSPREFKKVLDGFQKMDKALKGLEECTSEFQSTRIRHLLRGLPDLGKFVKSLQEKFVDELEPVQGADEDFDAAIVELDGIEEQFEDLLEKYRKQLKLDKKDIVYKDIGVNEIYQVQVPAKTKVPDKWHQMSTTKQVKRYWPPEISSLVKTLKEARERKTSAVKAFQSTIFEEFDKDYQMWLSAVKVIAELDCLLSLAKTSAGMEEPKVRPTIVEEERAFIDFKDLRHPCIQNANKSFIPNDVQLGVQKNMILLTGPNMAGKSTLLRMACVGVILAQLGCYVPATEASISPVDKIETRMGANDLIFQNSSTFKVEMDDAKRILTEATPKSLVILDELGRGTSTHDGVAIAQAVLHRLATHVGCIGFFATHYTSLVKDFAYHPQIRPCNMKTMVDEDTKEVVFLYQLGDGACSNSYGPHVAKMAGLPVDIVARAIEVSKTFDENMARREKAVRAAESLPLALQADLAWLIKKTTSGRVKKEDQFALDNISNGFQRFLKIGL